MSEHQTKTVRMPTAYLAEKMATVESMHYRHFFDDGIADVPVWLLAEIAEAAQAIVDEVDQWRSGGKEHE